MPNLSVAAIYLNQTRIQLPLPKAKSSHLNFQKEKTHIGSLTLTKMKVKIVTKNLKIRTLILTLKTTASSKLRQSQLWSDLKKSWSSKMTEAFWTN